MQAIHGNFFLRAFGVRLDGRPGLQQTWQRSRRCCHGIRPFQSASQKDARRCASLDRCAHLPDPALRRDPSVQKCHGAFACAYQTKYSRPWRARLTSEATSRVMMRWPGASRSSAMVRRSFSHTTLA